MSGKFVFPLFVLGTIASSWEGCSSNDNVKETAGTRSVLQANTGTSNNSLSPEKELTPNEEIFQTKFDLITKSFSRGPQTRNGISS